MKPCNWISDFDLNITFLLAIVLEYWPASTTLILNWHGRLDCAQRQGNGKVWKRDFLQWECKKLSVRISCHSKTCKAIERHERGRTISCGIATWLNCQTYLGVIFICILSNRIIIFWNLMKSSNIESKITTKSIVFINSPLSCGWKSSIYRVHHMRRHRRDKWLFRMEFEIVAWIPRWKCAVIKSDR